MALRTKATEMGMHTEQLAGRTQRIFFSPSEEENFTHNMCYEFDGVRGTCSEKPLGSLSDIVNGVCQSLHVQLRSSR